MNARHSDREAILRSHWSWPTCPALERIAIALGRAGWRVLYCNSPASFLKKLGVKRVELAPNVQGLPPQFLGHRLNAIPLAERWQGGLVARQLLGQAQEMGMTNPIAIYGHGHWLRETAEALRARSVYTVFSYMDRLPNREGEVLGENADLVLTIPRSVYHKLEAQWDGKVHWVPEFGPQMPGAAQAGDRAEQPARPARISRSRLGCLGPTNYRIHARLVEQVFRAHPDWHFLACGSIDSLRLPNLHDLGSLGPEKLAGATANFDAGFMLHDCSLELNLHCVPLKLFDYFATDIPVVSTPLIHLWEYQGLVYLADTIGELAEVIRKALAEWPDYPRRQQRQRIARARSVEELSQILSGILAGTAVGQVGLAPASPDERAEICEASAQ